MARKKNGWIGVDLDGTLAYHTKWKGVEHIGDPIKPMLTRVKNWLKEGYEVRILTARVAKTHSDRAVAAVHIQEWCNKHIGKVLIVTAEKDGSMIEVWDDRAVTVEKNTGRMLGVSRLGS